jgi:signal transduction histidine kinase
MLATDTEKLNAIRAAQPIETRTLIQSVAYECANGRESDLSLDIANEQARIFEDDLKKIVEELVENAFKFSDAGAPVEVKSSKDDNRFQIVVTNVGRGMTEDQINRVGAYVQFDRRLYEQQGSGLGLVIVKKIAGVYNGDVTLTSVPNEKTTVTVSLPV